MSEKIEITVQYNDGLPRKIKVDPVVSFQWESFKFAVTPQRGTGPLLTTTDIATGMAFGGNHATADDAKFAALEILNRIGVGKYRASVELGKKKIKAMRKNADLERNNEETRP